MINKLKKQAHEDLYKIVGKRSLNPGLIAMERLLNKWIDITKEKYESNTTSAQRDNNNII